jgi:hypothetical protein
MIAIENPNSLAVKAVYCHWDGYLEHNGRILNEHYTASPKVNNLIALGDLSSLRAEIGEKHAFSQLDLCEADREAYEAQHGNSCTFYTRDRGEDAPYKFFANAKEALDHYDGSWCEYFYLFRYDDSLESGKWYFKKGAKGPWKRLATALSKVKEEEFA